MLAFSQLQVPASLTLDIEQVDPWIEVTSLQHAAVSEAQLKITRQSALSNRKRRA